MLKIKKQLLDFEKVLLLLSLIIFSVFFYISDGLFYSFDSNETYSSLWHAYHFVTNDISNSMGLTDETFSTLDGSKSFFHTHQGNSPRLLSIVLYWLGFHSPQAHIYITFLIIGIPSLWILVRLLLQLSQSKLFTIIAVVFLFTNFILFFQWLFVTYRIWYFYLIFSSIFFLMNIDNKKIYKILLFTNLLFLFYFELIFAFFLSTTLFLIALQINDFNIKTIIKKYYYFLFAPFITLAILCFQLISFYGLDNFITDIKYTFAARNLNTEKIENILNFYEEKKIIFWHNFNNSFSNSFEIFFINDFKFYGVFLLSILLNGFVIPLRLFLLKNKKFVSIIIKLNTLKKYMNLFLNDKEIIRFDLKVLIDKIIYLFLYSLMLINAALIIKILNYGSISYQEIFISVPFVLCLFFTTFTVYFFKKYTLSKQSILIVNILFICVSFFIYLLKNNISDVHILSIFNEFDLILMVILLYSFQLFISFANFSNVKVVNINLKQILNLALILTASCLIISYASPGYLYSGYIYRAAPFLIFIKFIFYSVSIYFIFLLYYEYFYSKNSLLKFYSRSFLVTVLFTWIYVQASSISFFGITNYSFLKEMNEDTFKNSSFISNFYPASHTFISKSWGFQDDNLTNRSIVTQKNIFYLTASNKYLWFKDKENEIYKKPEYLICNSVNDFNIRYSQNSDICNNFDLIANIDSYKFAKIIKYKINKASGAFEWVIIKFDYTSNFGGLIFVE